MPDFGFSATISITFIVALLFWVAVFKLEIYHDNKRIKQLVEEKIKAQYPNATDIRVEVSRYHGDYKVEADELTRDLLKRERIHLGSDNYVHFQLFMERVAKIHGTTDYLTMHAGWLAEYSPFEKTIFLYTVLPGTVIGKSMQTINELKALVPKDVKIEVIDIM